MVVQRTQNVDDVLFLHDERRQVESTLLLEPLDADLRRDLRSTSVHRLCDDGNIRLAIGGRRSRVGDRAVFRESAHPGIILS